ncbi:hypothetical protein L1987_11769 [Smallanthus sonchifolius]|uniref:Uncharacterized protein n=1 Tax=Smallanthus sonchifolius TaxID=185202 RepID=A0ACB9JCS4_9ASTR|nr:hypothetical protein L1987_11769 [Smallanthus sonchifolius]
MIRKRERTFCCIQNMFLTNFQVKEKSKAGKQDSDKSLTLKIQFTLVDFARSNGALVSKDWKDTVTHVIAATYSNGVCLRTLKVLMAILNGKWIVTMECKEEPYEVCLDTHDCSGGPTAGRLRALSNCQCWLQRGVLETWVGDLFQSMLTGS